MRFVLLVLPTAKNKLQWQQQLLAKTKQDHRMGTGQEDGDTTGICHIKSNVIRGSAKPGSISYIWRIFWQPFLQLINKHRVPNSQRVNSIQFRVESSRVNP